MKRESVDHPGAESAADAQAGQLYQINVSYVPVEDRLLMRVSTTSGDEYRVWFTRRYASLLMGLLRREMEQYGGAPTLAANDETVRMFRQGAMNRKYDVAKGTEFPLGQQGILAHRAELQRREQGLVVLQILPGRGRGVTLNLNKNLLYMFYNLLIQGIEQAEWRVAPEQGASGNLH